MPEQTNTVSSSTSETQKNLKIWIAIGVVVLLIIVAIFVIFSTTSKPTDETQTTGSTSSTVAQSTTSSKSNSQAVIKHLGIELDDYDPVAKTVGDVVFTDAKMGEYDRPFFDFGFQIPANSARPNPTRNPQPTFIAPLGTKVRSLVDGTVQSIPKLYSNDYSVHVVAEGSEFIFETEHVINVVVQVGDKVTAGQVLAEISDYDAHNYNGLGLFEIGILVGGNPPSHVCPFAYLDEGVKEDLFDKIRALYRGWNEFRGEEVFDENLEIPGCIDLEAVAG